MPGQGAIIGVGTIDYPAEWQAADPRVLAELGVSKVVTITSTYDHRIIQGAESGLFLQKVHQLLTGADGFYENDLPGHGRALRGGGATTPTSTTRPTASSATSRSRSRWTS